MGEFYNPDKLYKGGSRNNSLINTLIPQHYYKLNFLST